MPDQALAVPAPVVQTPDMAAPLKDRFGPDVPRRIAEAIAVVRPGFPVRLFLADALDGYEDLELMPRGPNTSLGRSTLICQPTSTKRSRSCSLPSTH
ncbi:MAG TPA: hypothetical protein VFD47_08065 [Actinomycetota bacterium]|nr:hypothetical protein [Actinomycetota bacterium]